ncbi:hypothetical protein KR215_011116 [Drosophila sulfurigaster]|nr:hypothetical protein KR215_011116 [Drosophila sulfurigaster]
MHFIGLSFFLILALQSWQLSNSQPRVNGKNITLVLPLPEENQVEVVLYGKNLSVLEELDPKKHPVKLVLYTHNLKKVEPDLKNDVTTITTNDPDEIVAT